MNCNYVSVSVGVMLLFVGCAFKQKAIQEFTKELTTRHIYAKYK